MQAETSERVEDTPDLEDAALKIQSAWRKSFDAASPLSGLRPRPPPLSEKQQKLLGSPRDVVQIRAVYAETRKELAHTKEESDNMLAFKTVAKELRAAVKKVNVEKQVLKGIKTEYAAHHQAPKPKLRRGILTVRVVAAYFLSTRLDPTPNPYVVVSLGSNKQRGTTRKATSNPVWKKNAHMRQFSFMVQCEETHRYIGIEVFSDGLGEKKDELIGYYEMDVHCLNVNQWYQRREKLLVDGEPDRDKEIEFGINFRPEAVSPVAVTPAKEENPELDPASITVEELERNLQAIQATLLRIRTTRTIAIQGSSTDNSKAADSARLDLGWGHRKSAVVDFEQRYRLALEREKERKRRAQLREEEKEKKDESSFARKTTLVPASVIPIQFNADAKLPAARRTIMQSHEPRMLFPSSNTSIAKLDEPEEEPAMQVSFQPTEEGTSLTKKDATNRLRRILRKGVELSMLSKWHAEHIGKDDSQKAPLKIGQVEPQTASKADKTAKPQAHVPKPPASRGINRHGVKEAPKRSLPQLIVTKSKAPGDDSELSKSSPPMQKGKKKVLGLWHSAHRLRNLHYRNPDSGSEQEDDLEESDDGIDQDKLSLPANLKAIAAFRKSRFKDWQPVNSRRSSVRPGRSSIRPQSGHMDDMVSNLANRFPGHMDRNMSVRELCESLPEGLRGEFLKLMARIDDLNASLCSRVERVEEIHQERLESEDVLGNVLAQTSLGDCIDSTSNDDVSTSSDISMDEDFIGGSTDFIVGSTDTSVHDVSMMQSEHRGDRMAATSHALDAIRGSVVANIALEYSVKAHDIEDSDKPDSRLAAIRSSNPSPCHSELRMPSSEEMAGMNDREIELATELQELASSMNTESIYRGLQKAYSSSLPIARPHMSGLIAELEWRHKSLVQNPTQAPPLAMQRQARQRGIAVAKATMHRQEDLHSLGRRDVTSGKQGTHHGMDRLMRQGQEQSDRKVHSQKTGEELKRSKARVHNADEEDTMEQSLDMSACAQQSQLRPQGKVISLKAVQGDKVEMTRTKEYKGWQGQEQTDRMLDSQNTGDDLRRSKVKVHKADEDYMAAQSLDMSTSAHQRQVRPLKAMQGEEIAMTQAKEGKGYSMAESGSSIHSQGFKVGGGESFNNHEDYMMEQCLYGKDVSSQKQSQLGGSGGFPNAMAKRAAQRQEMLAAKRHTDFLTPSHNGDVPGALDFSFGIASHELAIEDSAVFASERSYNLFESMNSEMVQLLREGHEEILELKTEEELEVSMASADMAELRATQLAMLDLVKEANVSQNAIEELVPHELLEQSRKIIADVSDATRDRFGKAIEAVLAVASDATIGTTSNVTSRKSVALVRRRFAGQMSSSIPATIHRKTLFDEHKATLSQRCALRKSFSEERDHAIAQGGMDSIYSDGLHDYSWDSSDIIQDQQFMQMSSVDCFDCQPWETQALIKQERWPQSLSLNLKKLAIARRWQKDDMTRPRLRRKLTLGPIVCATSTSPSQQSIGVASAPGLTSSGRYLSIPGSMSKLVTSPSSALLARDSIASRRSAETAGTETGTRPCSVFLRGISGWIIGIDDVKASMPSVSLNISSDSWPPAMSLLSAPLKPKSPRELEEDSLRSMAVAAGRAISSAMLSPKSAVGLESSDEQSCERAIDRRELPPVSPLASSSARPQTVPGNVGRQPPLESVSTNVIRIAPPQHTPQLHTPSRPCTVPTNAAHKTTSKYKNNDTTSPKSTSVTNYYLDDTFDGSLATDMNRSSSTKRVVAPTRLTQRDMHVTRGQVTRMTGVGVELPAEVLPITVPARGTKKARTGRNVGDAIKPVLQRGDQHTTLLTQYASELSVRQYASDRSGCDSLPMSGSDSLPMRM